MLDALEYLDNGLTEKAGEEMAAAVKMDPVRTAKRLGRERELLELNGLGGVDPSGSITQRRWSISSANRYLDREPSFVLEAGESSKSVELQQRYNCPLLRSFNLVGDTPLHMAARHGHEHPVAMLLQFGAMPSPKNKWQLTPLLEAVRAGHVGVVKSLLQYPLRLEIMCFTRHFFGQTLEWDLLCVRFEQIDTRLVRRRYGADPAYNTGDGNTALHIAAASAGYSKEVGVKLMTMLLQGVPEESLPQVARTRNAQGFTPLHVAKAHGGVEMVRVLMESLGPAEFFKTKAEMRNAPSVAPGIEFFGEAALKATKQINSRKHWEAELASLQALKQESKDLRAKQAAQRAAIVVQTVCRLSLARVLHKQLVEAAKLKAAIGDNSPVSSDEEPEPELEPEVEPEPEPEPEIAQSLPEPGVRNLFERSQLRRKFEEHMAVNHRPLRAPAPAELELRMTQSATRLQPNDATRGRRKKTTNLKVDVDK